MADHDEGFSTLRPGLKRAYTRGCRGLAQAVEQRRGEIEVEAKVLDARIYAEKPGAFVGRLQAYWHGWRAEGRVDPIAVS